MNPQKRNKIIVISSTILVILLILLLIVQNSRSNVYVQKKLVSQCEQLMRLNKVDYQICKVETDNKVVAINEQQELATPEIKPGDTIIFSLNSSQLIKNNSNEYVRNTLSAINSTDKIMICLNIYPIIVKEDLPPPMFVPLDISSVVIEDFYKNYNWNVFMSPSLLDKKTKGDNYICTKITSFKKNLPLTSVIFTIPPGSKLNLSHNDHSKYYGIKLSLIPPSLIPSCSNPESLVACAPRFIHFFVLTLPINFQ